MKRKFTSVFLLVAVTIAALTSFVSCKDYEDDLKIEQLAADKLLEQRLTDAIQELRDDLALEVARLEGLQQTCSTNCSTERAAIIAMFDSYYKLNNTDNGFSQDEVDSLLAIIKDKMGAIADGETVVNLINNAVAKADSAQATADSALAAAQAAQAAADSAQAAADSAQATANSAESTAQQAQAAADSAQAAADSAQVAADSALAALDSLRQDVLAAQTTADQALTKAQEIDGLRDTVQNIMGDITRIDSVLAALDFATHEEVNAVRDTALYAIGRAESAIVRADTALAHADAARSAVNTLSVIVDSALTALNARNSDQSDSIAYLYRKVDTLATDIAAAQATADSARIVADSAVTLAQEIRSDLNDYIANTNPRIDTLENNVDSIFGSIEDINERLQALQDSVVQLPTLKEAIKQLENKYVQVSDSLADLYDKVDSLDSVVNEAVTRLDTLDKKVADLTDRLNKLVTSININQAVNNVFGSINLPFGVRTNLLTVYYGKVNSLGAEFPTADPTYFWNGINNIEQADVDVFTGSVLTLDAYDDIILDKAGNSGTLYFTVNPSQASINLNNFKLVNSAGKEAPFKLENVAASKEVLTWGWSRATSPNGLYKARVTLKGNPGKAMPNLSINRDDLVDAYRDIVKGKKSIAGIAGGVVAAATEVAPVVLSSAPAYGIQYAWQDNGTTNTVMSQYDLAAISLHPFSYSFAKGAKFTRVPFVDALENAVHSLKVRLNKTMQAALPNDIFKFIDPNLTVDSMLFNIEKLQEVDFTATRNEIQVEFKLNLAIPVNTTITNVEVPVTGLNGTVHIPAQEATVTIPEESITGMAITIPADESYDNTEHTYNIQSEDGVTGTATIPEQDADFDVNSQTLYVDINLNTTFYVNDLDVSDQMEAQVLKIYDSLTGSLAPVNDMIVNLRGYINNINTVIKALNNVPARIEYAFDERTTEFENTIIKYLEQFNSALAPYLTPNEYLQPILLGYNSTDGLFRLTSTNLGHPLVLKSGKMTIFPTTRTVELISPAYKKWIAVTEAFDTKTGVAAPAQIAAANTGNINTILDGDVRRVSLTLQPGYTYAIVYEALDYSGKVAAKKYYVTIKK